VIVVRTCSRLAAPVAEVWAHATEMDGVNWELSPYVRMSVPRAARGLTIADAPVGEVAFRSWLLAFRFLPFDRHALQLDSVTPPDGFVEESTSLVQSHWRHERTLTATIDGGCEVVDNVTLVPRVRFTARLAGPIVRFLFAHRHRRLQSRFGGTPC
jgi:ligand-binding SRPBCC domain-containing protein